MVTFAKLAEADWAGVFRLFEERRRKRREQVERWNRNLALRREQKSGLAPLYAGLRSRDYDGAGGLLPEEITDSGRVKTTSGSVRLPE